MGQYKLIPLSQIKEPPSAARLNPEDEDILELAESIGAVGLINPITVREVNGEFEIIAGHRRFLACKAIGYSPVACVVLTDKDDETYEVMLAENVARKDLTPIEEAAMLRELQDMKNYGVRTLAKVTGKSSTWVQHRLELLSLPPDVQKFVHEHGMAVETARILGKVDDPDIRARWGKEIITSRVGSRTVQLWYQSYEQTKLYADVDEETLREIEDQREPTVNKFSCWLCGEKYPYEYSKSFLLCRDCYKALLRAKLEGGNDARTNNRHAVSPGGAGGETGEAALQDGGKD